MRYLKCALRFCCCGSFQWKGAEINAEHPEGVNALMYGAAGAHLGVVQVYMRILDLAPWQTTCLPVFWCCAAEILGRPDASASHAGGMIDRLHGVCSQLARFVVSVLPLTRPICLPCRAGTLWRSVEYAAARCFATPLGIPDENLDGSLLVCATLLISVLCIIACGIRYPHVLDSTCWIQARA